MNSQGRSQSGVALIVALAAVVIVAGIGMLMFTRTLNEVRHSGDDARIVQTLMLARGGANVGATVLVTDMKSALYPAVFATSSPGRWTYGKDLAGVNSQTPDAASVALDLKKLASRAQTSIDDLVCGFDALGSDVLGDVMLRVYFTATACNGAFALPSGVNLPDGRYVSGPPRLVTEDGNDVGIQEYALPYVLVSEATVGDYRRNIVVQGEYVFTVGEAPFSHYAYFTNRESSDGGRIWFTDNTLIDGPTHTNGHFSMHKTPWFGGSVTSAGCKFYSDATAYRNNCINYPSTRKGGVYFNSGTWWNPTTFVPVSGTNEPSLGIHVPEFADGVDWDASYVPLPTNSINQRRVAEGFSTGGVLRDDQGILFTSDLDSLTLTVGNAAGVEPKLIGDVWTPAATYQYVTAVGLISPEKEVEECHQEWKKRWGSGYWVTVCETRTVPAVYETVSYRFNEDNVLEQKDASGNWITQSRPFNGVIYVDGKVDRLNGPARVSPNLNKGNLTTPAVASFAMMTIVSPKDIRITSDLRYEQPPCAEPLSKANKDDTTAQRCKNLNYDNVLGVFSSDGDVIVGNENSDATLNAPHDVFVDAVLMSGKKQVRVENYASGVSKGAFNLLGGMIQENRGIFGQVDGPGYDRVYTYDPRMKLGLAPPFFPTTGIGAVQSVRYFSFGQREQVY